MSGLVPSGGARYYLDEMIPANPITHHSGVQFVLVDFWINPYHREELLLRVQWGFDAGLIIEVGLLMLWRLLGMFVMIVILVMSSPPPPSPPPLAL